LTILLLFVGMITARGQSSQRSVDDKQSKLLYQNANMHLCPTGKWVLGEDPWGEIVRVNMLKIAPAEWPEVPGVTPASVPSFCAVFLELFARSFTTLPILAMPMMSSCDVPSALARTTISFCGSCRY
jgi:hypothetical protein